VALSSGIIHVLTAKSDVSRGSPKFTVGLWFGLHVWVINRISVESCRFYLQSLPISTNYVHEMCCNADVDCKGRVWRVRPIHCAPEVFLE
jgi:hypothetical protein